MVILESDPTRRSSQTLQILRLNGFGVNCFFTRWLGLDVQPTHPHSLFRWTQTPVRLYLSRPGLRRRALPARPSLAPPLCTVRLEESIVPYSPFHSSQRRRWEGNSMSIFASAIWSVWFQDVEVGIKPTSSLVIPFDFFAAWVASPVLFMTLVTSEFGIKSWACRMM
jgi:hypothetical protein